MCCDTIPPDTTRPESIRHEARSGRRAIPTDVGDADVVAAVTLESHDSGTSTPE